MARAYAAQGKYREAEATQEKGLAIWRKSLGPDHPRLAAGLRNLGRFSLAQGHYAAAEAFLADSRRYQFAGLNDDELCHFFRLAASQRDSSYPWLATRDVYEAYLTEMVRRGTL